MKLALWALAFVPLIVSKSVFFPFISGKVLLIRSIIALVSVLFATHLFVNRDFRSGIFGRLKRVVRDPLFLSVTAFIIFSAISTFFAPNTFRAFFGDIERGEGLLGWLYFYGFFFYSLLLFDRKDWLVFFKANLFTGLFSVVKAFSEYFSGAPRPSAWVGNAAFLAGYLLFVLFGSLIVVRESKKDLLWRVFAISMIPVSIGGIFISGTRGAILGLILGTGAFLLYGAFHGKTIRIRKNITLRGVSIAILAALFLGVGLFVSTWTHPVWQKVPGLSRATGFTLQDATIQTRLISFGVSKKAIDPERNGVVRFLLGWGPENFSVAYNKYYNPVYYQYEHTWFDRAHNKLMDVLVMNGMLGLLAYLSIWGSIAWIVFRQRGFSADLAAALFFGVAFSGHLLFVFDQISTVIPLFAFFSFVVFTASLKGGESIASDKKLTHALSVTEKMAIYFAGIVGAFFLYGVLIWTAVSFWQMGTYLESLGTRELRVVDKAIDDATASYTYAQQDIRTHAVNLAGDQYAAEPRLKPLFDKVIVKMEDLVVREPYNPRHMLMLAGAYDKRGKASGSDADLKKAEGYYQRAFELAPMRQDVVYAMALNLGYQNRPQEGIALLRKMLEADPVSPETHYFLGVFLTLYGPADYREALKEMELSMKSAALSQAKDEQTKGIYRKLLKKTYEARNKSDFLTVAKRLERIDPDQADTAKGMVEEVEAGRWPVINFE